MYKKIITIVSIVVLLSLLTVPLSAAPANYPTGYQDVKFFLYIDGNSNGYLDYWSGTDVCIQSLDDGSKLSWNVEDQNTSINYIVYTNFGFYFYVNSFEDYWECAVTDATKISVPSNRYYDATGCGPYTDHIWIGYTTDPDSYLLYGHRVNVLFPSC